MSVYVSIPFDCLMPLVCATGLLVAFGWFRSRGQRKRPEAGGLYHPDEASLRREGLAVLVDGILVYEAKKLAERLETADIPFELKLTQDDRSFRFEGHGGCGQRMCILVDEIDFDRARTLL